MHFAANMIHRAMIGAAVALLASACGTETSTTSLWSASVPAGGGPKSIVVVAAGLGEGNRRILEDDLAKHLSQTGVVAKQSYQLFPQAAPSRDEARAAVQAAGFEGVLVSRLQNVTMSQRVVPGSYYNGGLWYGYYGVDSGWYNGYVVTDQNVNFENTLWDARGEGKLLWSSHTSTWNPSSTNDFADALSKKIVPQLGNAGFIPKTK
jgi:hypothetical protein